MHWSRQSVSRSASAGYGRTSTDSCLATPAEGDKLQSPAQRAKTEAQRPTPDQPIGKQNDALHQFIERTKKELEEKQRQGK